MAARLDDHRKLDLPDPTEDTVGASCHDDPDTPPDLFFSEKEADIKEAKRICRDCPVIDGCRAYAFATRPEFGVWGGFTADEIRRLIRRNQQASRARKAA